jgi:hypothetical protein
MSIEMSPFIISDLQLFVRRRDLLPDVNSDPVRLQSFRYGLQDLASPDRFWIVSPGCREEDYPRNICPDYYVFGNGVVFPAMLIRLFGFSSLEYWCWYSCRCCMIALMVACVHVALALRL